MPSGQPNRSTSWTLQPLSRKLAAPNSTTVASRDGREPDRDVTFLASCFACRIHR
ncbi:Uncharacterised protein [Mycobacteroides abscessus subsp. abscessus]|nr:Uncharacterised protein [Mycobacteroides abscessus subsp. abscessus]SKV77869.1 Uncharacterised protein [Mycobacteroides abscessus subsp. abscessus]